MDHGGRLEEVPEGMGRKTRALATVFIVACVAFWIFAFSPQARDIFTAPDQLEDEQYVAALDARCALTSAELDRLPSARRADNPTERAETVTAANELLRTMVNDLGAITGGTEDDRRLIGRWLEDWEVYLGDRSRHVERLLTDGDVRFLNTEDGGVFVAERMDGFIRVNDIDNCVLPGDV